MWERKISLNTSANDEEADCMMCPAFSNSPLASSLRTDCVCNKGYTGPDGVECTACIEGTYKDVNGTAQCSLCAKGTYSPSNGTSSCKSCPPFETTLSEGANTSSACNCIEVSD